MEEKNIQSQEGFLDSSVVSKLSSFFKVLGDETRVKIIYALSDKEMCVNEISQILDISQSAISHQLKQLRLEGQVKTRRDGKNIYYSLDDEHVMDILNQALTHIRHKLKENQD
ncbi:MAG: metalloregulator ArsR/SmtB family transcription factor [Acutalibacteraceae bacterium]|nr:metalloregulator ArsR/SmtB family transcription factor [Acutalibacteraceae bacterium]